MHKSIIFTIFSLLCLLNPAIAQYINTDSLAIAEGREHAILLTTLDSFEIFSPEILPEYFSPGLITSGYLLSQFSLPATGKVISRFGPRSGRMHTGTDIKMIAMIKYYHISIAVIVFRLGNFTIIRCINSIAFNHFYISAGMHSARARSETADNFSCGRQ